VVTYNPDRKASNLNMWEHRPEGHHRGKTKRAGTCSDIVGPAEEERPSSRPPSSKISRQLVCGAKKKIMNRWLDAEPDERRRRGRLEKQVTSATLGSGAPKTAAERGRDTKSRSRRRLHPRTRLSVAARARPGTWSIRPAVPKCKRRRSGDLPGKGTADEIASRGSVPTPGKQCRKAA